MMEPRLSLKGATMTVAGNQATATVELTAGSRKAVGRVVGDSTEDRSLALVGEATVNAVREFLPPGYALALERIHLVPSGSESAVGALVRFLTPEEHQGLLGIAPLVGDPSGAAAKAVLSAVNRRAALLLGLPRV